MGIINKAMKIKLIEKNENETGKLFPNPTNKIHFNAISESQRLWYIDYTHWLEKIIIKLTKQFRS